MTVTDAEGGTVSEQKQVTVATRPVTAKQAGTEGKTVPLAGPDGETDVRWSFEGEARTSPATSRAARAPDTTVTCYRDGTYRILYDTG